MTHRITRPCCVLTGVAMLLMMGSPPVRSDILFDNFGPGDTVNDSFGWTVSEASGPLPETWTPGDAFTVPGVGDFNLTSLTVAIEHVPVGGPNSVTLGLYDDSGGFPGALLESWTLSGLPTFDGSPHPPTTVASVGTLVSGGSQYWLVASTVGDWDAWNQNIIGDTGPHFCDGPPATICDPPTVTDQGRGAFRVEGTPAGPTVPEPGAFGLLAACIVGLIAVRPRRKHA